MSHNLARHWTLGISGGGTHTVASGTAEVPVELEIGPIVIPVFVLQHYSQTTTLPYAQGTASYNWRHMVWSVGGGESVTPGNGFFLASRNIGVNGVFSYNWRHSNISGGGFYSRLTSIAYASSNKVNTADFQISYAANLRRYLGTNVRYEHVDYGNIGVYSARADNRVTFGLYFSSKASRLRSSSLVVIARLVSAARVPDVRQNSFRTPFVVGAPQSEALSRLHGQPAADW